MPLAIKPPVYTYCPYCGSLLQFRMEEGKPHQYCPERDFEFYPHNPLAVAAIVLGMNGTVLLAKRAREPFVGLWTLPSGFVDFGEHPDEALIREIKEETGLEVAHYALRAISNSDQDPRAQGVVLITYVVTVNDGELKNDAEENLELRYWPMDKLPPMAWKIHEEVLKHFNQQR